jgi:hypothetical protein
MYSSYYQDKKSNVNGMKLVGNIVDHIMDKTNWEYPKTSVGVIEYATIEGIKYKAKLDTGNSVGGITIHAEDIKVKGEKVSFKLKGKKFTKKIEDQKEIKVDAGFDTDTRYYVKLNMSMGGKIAKLVLFNLDNRSDNVYDVLIDKGYMADNNLVIDPVKKFTLGEQYRKVNTFREMYI